MKKKIPWLAVSCLMAVSLVLGSCAPADEIKGGVYGRATTTPQYGGEITFVLGHSKASDYFDPIYGSMGSWLASITYDKLVTADWGRGPAGTGEFSFEAHYIPLEFRTGQMAESWERPDMSTIIWHLRPGVHFHDKPPANGREVKADDLLFWAERCRNHPQCAGYRSKAAQDAGEVATYTKIDDYTVKVVNYEPYPQMVEWGSWTWIHPPEAIEEYGDLKDWRNACGTGPFMVEDCIPGSSVTFKRNPDYWMKDPVHPENQLPYIDTLTGLMIVEESARLAGLRSHQIDILAVPYDKAEGMKESNPELLFKPLSPNVSRIIFMRTDKEPWSDKRVRQAVAMAIDQPGMIRDYYKGNAVANTWPCLPGNVEGYTPLEEAPEEVRWLYEYHPEKAKELLAEAGYPDGFDCELLTYAGDPIMADGVQMIKEYLAQVGVNAEISIEEGATHTSLIFGIKYQDLDYTYWGNSSPQSVWGWAHGGVVPSTYNFSGPVVDPVAEESFDVWGETPDPAERARLMKAEYLRQAELCWEIPMPSWSGTLFWAPWIGGYHGERGMGLTMETGAHEIFRYPWVDQELKSAITGQ